MLKRKQRLSKRQFDTFFRTGKRLHTPLFQVIYAKTEDFHGAAVVGKKVHKRAVDRNRLRRRVYNILYRLSQDRDLKGVYIIIAKPPAANVNFTAIKQAITALLDEAETKNSPGRTPTAGQAKLKTQN